MPEGVRNVRRGGRRAVGGVPRALARALPLLFTARVMLMVAVPLVAALAIWGALAWVFWDDWARILASALRLDAAGNWLARYELRWLATGSVTLLLALLLIPATLFTALFVIAVLAMPILVEAVARRDFPQLERRRGGSNTGSVFNALVTFAIYALLWLLSLPLWLIPGLALVVPWLLTAWLNQRMFRYDALAEHASAEERERIVVRAGRRLYALGLVLALLQFIPLVNLVAPIYAALAFTELCLEELAALRGPATPGGGRAPAAS